MLNYFIIGTTLVSAQLVPARPYGDGQQYSYNAEAWDGKEAIVTKLVRHGVTYVYVRCLQKTFEIRTLDPKPEVLFRLDLNENRLLHNYDTKLVDIYRDGASVSALLYGHPGYYLVTSSKNKPRLKKGQFLFFPKGNRVDKWNMVSDVAWLDFYAEDGWVNEPDIKVGSIRLVGLSKIECTYVPRDRRNVSQSDPLDVFSIEGDKLLRNGTVIRAVNASKIADEKEYLKDLEKATDELVRTRILKLSDSKEEFLKIILENNRDKTTYDAIKARLDRAFAGVDKPEPSK